jgi:ABC-type glycerol-3-phosphate transport system substrate-binding protein
LIAALALSACRTSDSPDAGSRRAETSPRSFPTVRIIGRKSTALVALERLGRGQPPPDSRLDVTGLESGRQVVDELRSARAAGRQPYDLAVVPHRFLGELVEAGVVAPLDAAALDGVGESDFFDGWWRATGWYRGSPYGLPFAARSMSLWIRGDFWDEEDADAFYRKYRVPVPPPAAWADVERMVEFQHRPAAGRFGTVLAGAADEGLFPLWLQYAYSFGARIFDAPRPDEYGDIVVNSPPAVRATELYLKLLRNFSPPDARGYTLEQAFRAFQDGQVAIAVMWHDLAARLDDQRESKVPMRTDYERVPSAGTPPVTLLEADLLVVLEQAPTRDAAVPAARWALSHEAQRELTLNGGFSARPSVYADPAIKGHLLQHKWTYPRLAAGAVPVPMVPEADRIAALMARELSRAASGELQPKAALDRIAVEIARMLAGKAKLRYPPR